MKSFIKVLALLAGMYVFAWCLGTVVYGATEPGPAVTTPQDEAWKIQVTIQSDDGKVKGVMVPVDENHQPLTWSSQVECIAVQSTDSFKEALGALAKHLISQGFDPEHTTVTIQCVPVAKSESF